METPPPPQIVDERTYLLRKNSARSNRLEPNPINVEVTDDYDQRESTPQQSQLGYFAVIFLTVNATLGAGLLNIPYAFAQSGGLFPSICAQMVHVLLVVASLLILTGCSNISKSDSLQGVVTHFCGRFWRLVCSLSIFLYSYGACVTYVIIIGDQLTKIFGTFYPSVYNQHWYFDGDLFIILICIFTILPLCCSKHISFLKFASFFGFLCTLYLTILIFVEFLKIDDHYDNSTVHLLSSDQPIGSIDWSKIFNVIPVLTFSYQCQLSWVPTYAQIEKRDNYFRISVMILVSLLICFLSYTWTAVFGILSFGSNGIEKDIMQNYDPKDPFVLFAMILLIVKTIVVYPVLLFCGRIVIEELMPYLNSRQPFLLRVIIATIWVLSSCTLAILVPNIAVVINYLGSLANLFVFILPGLCLYYSILDDEQLALMQKELWLIRNRTTLLCISIIFVAYGIFILVISIAQIAIQQTRNISHN